MDLPESDTELRGAYIYATLGTELNNTDIELVLETELGIDGWALHKFGNKKDDNISSNFPSTIASSLSSTPRHLSKVAGSRRS